MTATLGVAAALATACLLVPATAAAGVLDNYCHPTGDYCTSVEKQRGVIKLRFATSSFTGKIEICSQPVGGNKECREFRLRKKGDLYVRSVNWERHFGGGAGLYKASWYFDGNGLGPALSFVESAAEALRRSDPARVDQSSPSTSAAARSPERTAPSIEPAQKLDVSVPAQWIRPIGWRSAMPKSSSAPGGIRNGGQPPVQGTAPQSRSR